MEQQEILDCIENALRELERDWKDAKAMLLSEDDLKCHFFRLLHKNSEFLKRKKTMDSDIKGTSVHTEIKFFDENGELTLKPDLTILDPKKLSIAHSVQRYKSTSHGLEYAPTTGKGFHSIGSAIIIEFAFVKKKYGITHIKDVKKIRKDFEKLKRIIQIDDTEDIRGYLVVFSKANGGKRELYNLIREIEVHEKINFFWGSADYIFDRRRNIINP